MANIRDIPTYCEISDSRCNVCGERADAYWAGVSTLAICRCCAIKVLPALIADTLISEPCENIHLEAHRVQPSIQAAFWRAISARQSGALRRIKQPPGGI